MTILLYLFLSPMVINFFLALVPALLLLNYFYKRDPRPEPRQIVMKAFILGVLSTIPAIIIELILGRIIPSGLSPLLVLALRAFIVVSLVEESCKLFMVKKFIYPLPEFDEVTDGIIYTMASGLGFAFLENIIYSINSYNSMTVLITRGVTAVPLHGLTSGLMGYYIGRAKIDNLPVIPLGLFLAVLYHGLYDFVLFYGGSLAWLSIPLLLILFFHARKVLQGAIDEDHPFFRY